MRKLLVIVGLLGVLSMVGAAQANLVNVEYCTNISTSDIIINITQDIFFYNSSAAYNNVCFEPADVLGGAAGSSGVTDNVTIDFNGFTLYINSSAAAHGIYGSFGTNWTIINGTIDFTGHTTAGDGITFNSADNADMTIKNMTIISAVTGIHVSWLSAENLIVENSTITGSSTYDLDLRLPQSEITSCGNIWNTFRPIGSLLSKDACTEPPATYKDYIVQVNCTQTSSTSFGALVCTNTIPIPSDCTNITTDAWTVLTPQNESWLNDNTSFTRFTCNPEGDRITYCDNLFKPCSYFNFNSYPSRRWDDYAAGQNATSFHVIGIPPSCLDNTEGGNFTMIGRLHLACKSFTQSGIEIDGTTESCEHELICFNSNTMEERFPDCTSILTPCPFSCVEGVCMVATTTTLREGADPLIDLSPYGAGAWVSMLFTPFAIITMMLVGIGAYFEAQVKDAKGGIFLAVMIVGVLAFTYLGLYPAWVGILIAIVCAGILSKFVMHLW